MIHEIKSRNLNSKITKVAGFDSKGFIYGSIIARALGVGFVIVRKAGNTPGNTINTNYSTEYSDDSLEIDKDLINQED